MAAASGKRRYFREKQNLDSGPSLHVRQKCNDSFCLPTENYRKHQVSIITVWRSSGHIVLFSESQTKPGDLMSYFWCHWAHSPQATAARNNSGRVVSSGQTNCTFKNENLRGKYHRNQLHGPREGEAAAFTSHSTLLWPGSVCTGSRRSREQ